MSRHPRVSTTAPVVVVPIAKNAHTSLTHWTIEPWFRVEPAPDYAALTTVAVVRDPMRRYVSGLVTVLRDETRDPDAWAACVARIDEQNTAGWFYTHGDDPHLRPQVDALEGAMRGRGARGGRGGRGVRLFDLDCGGIDDMVRYLERMGCRTNPEPVPVDNPGCVNALHYAMATLDPEPIREHYRHDYELLRMT